jgi:Flp pilus assembly protein TadD
MRCSVHPKLAIVLAIGILPAGKALAADCAPPPQSQAKLQAHPSPETYAAIGQYFGDKGQHACAAQAWAAALKAKPDSAKFAYMLGLNLFFSGQPEPAVAALQRSARLNPKELQTHLLLAAVLQQLRRAPQAAAEWQAALDIDPASALALDGLAKSYMAAGNFPAVAQLLRAAKRDENLSLDLALAYQRMGKLDEAKSVLAAALDASPASLELANALAVIDLKQGQHEAAAAILEKQYALRPRDLETQIDYFGVLVAGEDSDKAAPLGKALLARAPSRFEVLYLNGLLERQNGDYAAAKTHLEEAAALNPDNPDCRYNLGVALARLRQPAEARQQFEKAVALGWNGPEIHFELAKADTALGDAEAAARETAAYQQAERGKQQRTVAVNKAAQADQEMRSGDLKASIDHYREAVAAWPANPELNSKLAAALDANGDHAEAEQSFRTALQSDPNRAEAWAGLAKALAAQSKLPEAREAAARALQLAPDDAATQALARSLNSDPPQP